VGVLALAGNMFTECPTWVHTGNLDSRAARRSDCMEAIKTFLKYEVLIILMFHNVQRSHK
jgi:hypothetical protein